MILPKNPLPPLVAHAADTAVRPDGALSDPVHYMRDGTLRFGAPPPLSLYVHLPWCLKKCPYCDFNSHESRHAGGVPEDRYVDALIADLEVSLPLVWGRTVISIFFGGGTPSLFSPESMERLIGAIRARLPLAPDCEITMEANPGTFERDRFRAFRAAGVTRLSVGVQTFDDRHLEAIGRVHDGAQARAALEEAASAFDTFNLDLMYALPGQTMAQLENDVATALSFKPPHLSIYHLTVEPNTMFARHPPRLPEEDDAYDMLDRITAMTGADGLARYEISAYARGDHACRHNLNYWRFGDYLGIGAGAHGKLTFAHRVVRQVRFREPELYMRQALAGRPLAQENDVTRADLPFEYMMNALRLRDGFALQDFSDRTGLSVAAINKPLDLAEQKGLIVRDLHSVKPTERGFDFLSDLQALFLAD